MRSLSTLPKLTTVLMLCGCQVMSAAGSNRLPSNSSDSNAIRNQLLPALSLAPVSISYRSGLQCTYIETKTEINGPTKTSSIFLTARRVGENIQIVARESLGLTSVMLINSQGHVIDFNFGSEESFGQRSNPQNFNALSEKRKNTLSQQRAYSRVSGLHILNDTFVKFPEYSSRSMQVGQIASTISVEGGEPWGVLSYKGTSSYQGKAVALFDLMRLPTPTESSMRLAGFNVVDIATGLPLVSVIDSGAVDILKQISCQ